MDVLLSLLRTRMFVLVLKVSPADAAFLMIFVTCGSPVVRTV